MTRILVGLLLVVLLLIPSTLLAQDKLPQEAQGIVSKADAKIEALKKAYDEACAKVRAQEVKDLQHVYESLKKSDPPQAVAVKTKIELLTEVAVAVKGQGAVEAWLDGPWMVSGTEGNYKAIWKFKGKAVTQGDWKGRIIVEGNDIQVLWDNSAVEVIKVPDPLGDTTTGTGRFGVLTIKRLRQ